MLDGPPRARRELALSGRAFALPGGSIEIAPAATAVRYILRCAPECADFVRNVFGTPIPTTPCTAVNAGSRAALWLGPDEWLLLAEEGAQPAIEAAFASIAREIPFSLVDVSHRNVAVELSGPAAADVLSSGCPLDLDMATFPPGNCTRTLFGKCEVVLWRTGEETFRLEFWRSYAEYVWQLLETACIGVGAAG